MNLLFILLSVMTFTVESKNAVSTTGECPNNIEVTYACSYQKGTVRSGDEATLSLGKLGGMVVEQIEVYVKSNKDAGAGIFTVQVNGETISTKSGTLKNWIGKFDNQNYHAISLLNNSVSNVQAMTVQLTGTANSLYIEKYVVTYSSAPVNSVTLMNGEEVYTILTEETGGEGVTLPNMANLPKWQFIGWTETPVESTNTALPSLYSSGMQLYPDEDMTLWAVYAYQPAQQVYMTELVSGDYIYVNTPDNKAMSGVPVNGKMDVDLANIEDIDQYYSIVFNETADSATISYTATGAYIGFTGTKLTTKQSKWAVFHEGDKTAFYTTVNGKAYMLYPGKNEGQGDYTALTPVSNITQAQTALLSIEPPMEEPWYSCYPQSLQAVENTAVEGREIIVPFGIYELHIQDGHKRLRIR